MHKGVEMKTYKIEYQTVHGYWTSEKRTIKIKAASDLDAEIKLDKMFDNSDMRNTLYSFVIL